MNLIKKRRFVRSLPGASQSLPLATPPGTWSRGVIAGNNGNGTVQVNVAGDPVAVTAQFYDTYANPTAGDIVHVYEQGNVATVASKFAQAPALTAGASSAANAITGIFVNATPNSASLIGNPWPPNAICTLSPIDVGLTTNSSGQWSFAFANSFEYTYGYNLIVGAGGTGQGTAVPINDDCTLTTVVGISYTAEGSITTNDSAAIVVAGWAIGA
jgi:hypothetical protein